MSNQFVTEVPKAPEEVNLNQALGLIPKIACLSNEQSFIDRLRIHDPVIRVYAITALINKKIRFNNDVLTIALHVAQRSSYVRQLLIPELITLFRFDLIDQVVEMEKQVATKVADLTAMLMESQFNNDYAKQVALHEALYLQTGDARHVNQAATISRERLPWKAALKHNVRMVFVQNEHTIENALLSLMQLLERESAKSEFMALAPIINSLDENKLVRSYIIIMKYFWEKNYQKCIDFMVSSNVLEATKDQSPLITNIAARCYEKLNNYKLAAEYYEHQNIAQADERYKPETFIESINERAGFKNPTPIPDKHDNYFIMTGFPRSGTTLLENVLNSHPDVVTCEETSSLIGSFSTAFSAPMDRDPERKKLMLRLAFHQSLYYKNIDRHVSNMGAKAIIDKTPIIAANIKYMEKIFPNKRYIFSIRHPYDVVLSNIKQVYTQNTAMTAFNDVYNACVLYNKVMSDWFEVFPGDTDRVCYIKYDDLVSDFRHQIQRALAFLQVDWTDDVLDFAEHSKQRPVRTPSYTNVRKGLTIGVQTSWENFAFIFDERCKALLDPWVKRFGYSH